jgi:hypothetical protein
MVQQTSPATVQSVSALQRSSPWLAGSQLFCALATRLVDTHASPLAESQVVSLVQNWGHVCADWQTLPAAP